MELNPQEQNWGVQWFIGAGLAAVILSVFLYRSDELLSNSDREERLGNTLYELRSAQTVVAGGIPDSRQLVEIGQRSVPQLGSAEHAPTEHAPTEHTPTEQGAGEQGAGEESPHGSNSH